MINMKRKILFSIILTFLFLVVFKFESNASFVYIVGGVDIDVDLGINTPDNYPYQERLVTDSSQFNSSQPYYIIDTSDFGYSRNQLINMGYNTLVVVFELDIMEEDDGYQELYIYQETYQNATALCTPITNFEHGSGFCNSQWVRYEFYAEIDISSMNSSSIIFRFGAHGKGDDDWQFRLFQVELGASFNYRCYTTMLWVEGANTGFITGDE